MLGSIGPDPGTGSGACLRAVDRHMAELHQARPVTQRQNLCEQLPQVLQVALAKVGDGAEIGRVERHNAHEINALAAGLGHAPRGVDAAAIPIEQQRRHHHRVERRLASLAGVAGQDLGQVQLIPHDTQHERREMVLGHKVLRGNRQQQRIVDLPGAKCLAHAPQGI